MDEEARALNDLQENRTPNSIRKFVCPLPRVIYNILENLANYIEIDLV